MIRTLAVSEAKQDCARLSLATNAVAVNKTMRPAVFIKATVKLDCTWMPTYIFPRDEQDPQPRQTPTSDSGCGQEAHCTRPNSVGSPITPNDVLRMPGAGSLE